MSVMKNKEYRIYEIIAAIIIVFIIMFLCIYCIDKYIDCDESGGMLMRPVLWGNIECVNDGN